MWVCERLARALLGRILFAPCGCHVSMYPEVSLDALVETWTVAIKRYSEQFWTRFREVAVQTIERLILLPDIEDHLEEHLLALRTETSFFSDQGNTAIFLEDLCQHLCLVSDEPQDWSRLYDHFLDPVRRFLGETSRSHAPVLEGLRNTLYLRLVEFMLDLPDEYLTNGSARSSPRCADASDFNLGTGDLVIATSPHSLSSLSQLAAHSRRHSFGS